MSACWRSDLRRFAAGTLAAFVAALGPLAAAPDPAGAADSARAGARIVVDHRGVLVEESSDSGDVNVRVSVGTSGVIVRGAGEDVRVARDGGVIVVNDEAGLVRVFADAEVDTAERVDGDVVAVFGSVRVRGDVAGNVVAVGGSVRLDPGATVEGDVVAVGGVLDQAEGATVGGESVSVGFFPTGFGVPTLPLMLAAVFVGWALTLFVGWLLALVVRDRMVCVARTASRRTTLSFFLGLALLPFVLMASGLLLITVIGIPVALLLPVLHVLVAWTGQVAATAVIGSKLVRRPLGEGSFLGQVAAGSLFVALFFVAGAALSVPSGVLRTVALFFSLLGVLLLFGLTTIGSGAVVLSRFGRARPADGVPGAPASAASGGPAPGLPGAAISPPAGA